MNPLYNIEKFAAPRKPRGLTKAEKKQIREKVDAALNANQGTAKGSFWFYVPAETLKLAADFVRSLLKGFEVATRYSGHNSSGEIYVTWDLDRYKKQKQTQERIIDYYEGNRG